MNQYDQILVKQVMENRYVLVDGLTTVAEAIVLARTHSVKALIVEKRHEHDEYGIVVMNDIAKKVLAKNRSPQRVNIYEVMTKPALCVDPDMNVKYCARLFERFGISRAPVVSCGELLGMVSYNNIVMKGMVRDDED